MAAFEETQGGTGDSQQSDPGDTGLPEDVLDAATAPPQTGSGGPTDRSDLGRLGGGTDDLAGRDLASESEGRDGGASTMGTDIGSGSA